MNESGRAEHGGKRKKTSSTGNKKAWGLEGSMKSSSIVWWKRERLWKGRRAEWVQTSQDSFGSHVRCGLQLMMCRLRKDEKGNSSHGKERCRRKAEQILR